MAEPETELEIMIGVPSTLRITAKQRDELAKRFENQLVEVLEGRKQEAEALAKAKAKSRQRVKVQQWIGALGDE